MNKQQITELLRLHHKYVTNRQLEMYIEQSAHRIAEETGGIKKTFLINSIAGQRWYDLPSRAIDIVKVEILDTSTNGRYHLIPKLTDSHKLLKSDPDTGTGDLT